MKSCVGIIAAAFIIFWWIIQDTSRLQYRWLKLLTGERTAVFVVGDDDQSIYAFRGANTGNMKEFERDFRIPKIIKLEQNYRSHGNILNAANTLIRNNGGRLGKICGLRKVRANL